MTDQYLIEAGVDGYLLEDGTGVLIIDQRVETKAETVGVTESTNKSWLKVILESFSVTEASNTALGFVKVATQLIIGLTESLNKKSTQYEYHLEGLTDACCLEDGSGVYLQEYGVKISNSTVGATEASQKTLGFLKNISETIELSDARNYVTGFFKVVTSAIAGIEYLANKFLTEVN